MYGRTNAGGDIKTFAFILATYPIGSTCTATDGSRTLRLKDTSGYGVFYVPYAATWTVTATDGTETATQSVEITKEGETVSVELSYALWLFKSGNQYYETTGGWTSVGYSVGTYQNFAPTITDSILLDSTDDAIYTSEAVGTAKKIDLSKITTLSCEVSEVSGGGAIFFCASSVKNLADSEARANKYEAGVLELDVSGLPGEYYVALYTLSSSTSKGRANVTTVKGE